MGGARSMRAGENHTTIRLMGVGEGLFEVRLSDGLTSLKLLVRVLSV